MISSIPNPNQVLVEKSGGISRPWYGFLRDWFASFSSNEWTPEFSNLTIVGAANFSARYTLTGKILYFDIEIVPVAAGTTQSTAGATKITNLPFIPVRNGLAKVVASVAKTDFGTAVARKETRDLEFPTWAATNETVLISGLVQIEG